MTIDDPMSGGPTEAPGEGAATPPAPAFRPPWAGRSKPSAPPLPAEAVDPPTDLRGDAPSATPVVRGQGFAPDGEEALVPADPAPVAEDGLEAAFPVDGPGPEPKAVDGWPEPMGVDGWPEPIGSEDEAAPTSSFEPAEPAAVESAEPAERLAVASVEPAEPAGPAEPVAVASVESDAPVEPADTHPPVDSEPNSVSVEPEPAPVAGDVVAEAPGAADAVPSDPVAPDANDDDQALAGVALALGWPEPIPPGATDRPIEADVPADGSLPGSEEGGDDDSLLDAVALALEVEPPIHTGLRPEGAPPDVVPLTDVPVPSAIDVPAAPDVPRAAPRTRNVHEDPVLQEAAMAATPAAPAGMDFDDVGADADHELLDMWAIAEENNRKEDVEGWEQRRPRGRLADRWSNMRRGERLNVVLYALTGVSILAMTLELLAGPDALPTDVATTPSVAAGQTVTTVRPTTTVTFSIPENTEPAPVVTQAPRVTSAPRPAPVVEEPAPDPIIDEELVPPPPTTARPPATTTPTFPPTTVPFPNTFPTPVPPVPPTFVGPTVPPITIPTPSH